MIDEKKIEEAANRYAFDKCSEKDIDMYDLDTLLSNAFYSGIDWLFGNLWHDSSDAPTYTEKCLVELTDNCNDSNKNYVVSANYRGGGWDRNVSDLVSDFDYKITHWLYIDDLLKGGEVDIYISEQATHLQRKKMEGAVEFLEKLQKLPYLATEGYGEKSLHVVSDCYKYVPTLVRYEGEWGIDWIHSSENDSIKVITGATPEDHRCRRRRDGSRIVGRTSLKSVRARSVQARGREIRQT